MWAARRPLAECVGGTERCKPRGPPHDALCALPPRGPRPLSLRAGRKHVRLPVRGRRGLGALGWGPPPSVGVPFPTEVPVAMTPDDLSLPTGSSLAVASGVPFSPLGVHRGRLQPGPGHPESALGRGGAWLWPFRGPGFSVRLHPTQRCAILPVVGARPGAVWTSSHFLLDVC